MHKIRCIVAYENKEIINDIVNSIKELPYIEIVGTATNGDEVYEEVINLKPEMVFTECFDNEDKLKLVKQSYAKLKNKMPTFNLFTKGDNISQDELQDVFKLVDLKLNIVMPKIDLEWIKDVTKDYYDLKYKK